MFRSLKHYNYRLFFSGQLISLVGTWMQSVALAWLIYRLTHSSMLLGVVSFASQIPFFLLSPLSGVIADRYNRHRILLITQSSSMLLAFILATLTILGRIEIWQILLLSVLLGIVNSFDVPARQAFVVEMVGKDDLSNAIALNSSTFNGARMIGPAIAGALIAIIGEGWCFFINALSYIAVCIGLLLMRLPPQIPVTHTNSTWEHAKEGFRFIKNNKPIRAPLLLIGCISLLGIPYSVLMPVFADQILKGGPGTLGILMGVSGSGAFLGALTLTTRQSAEGINRWILFSCIGFSLSLIAFAQSSIFWLSAILLFPVGYCMIVQLAGANTLIQSMIPDRFRGRVMSVYSMMLMGMTPFGALLAGVIAKPLGAPLTVAIGGIACLIALIIFWKDIQQTLS